MYDKIYRPCPVCRAKLCELMKHKENGVNWDVFECPNCGSEVWIDPYKKLRQTYRR